MINEHAIKNSFRAIKADILGVQGDLMNMKMEQAKILMELEKLVSGKKSETKVITKNVVKPHRATYIAAKEGKKFHVDTCAYARNIMPKSKIKFKSKTTALNQGYKPCSCVK